MIMLSKGILVASFILLVTNAAQAAAADPKGARTILDNGSQRDFIPLTELKIQKALIGQRVVVDQKIDWEPNKHSMGFSEAF